MARRKHPTKGETPEGQTAIPFQDAPAPEAQPEELLVFPHELHPGDRVRDDEPHEWQVVASSQRVPPGQDDRGADAEAWRPERQAR